MPLSVPQSYSGTPALPALASTAKASPRASRTLPAATSISSCMHAGGLVITQHPGPPRPRSGPGLAAAPKSEGAEIEMEEFRPAAPQRHILHAPAQCETDDAHHKADDQARPRKAEQAL